ncbi:Hypothetical predicted protein [Olea europaea subsp. europaea]|uniref:Uncharacterized protein n=1 Tax=Olea europaea subsp. europaea TaxID=158383 RepID=A0A8S0T1P1_OLEEU|nr:Hypothetical predicted protein [Olea europaea subsp. europaea]
MTSAFDGGTGSTAYIREHDRKGRLEKEARFDDVTDVPVDEKKVEEPQEFRGKNEGRKGAEVGSGNNIEE